MDNERNQFMYTKEHLQQMNESTLRKDVLIPLLKAMQYHDVFEHHSMTERGKDIVCWKADDLGCRTNLALVVKAVPITGKATIYEGTTGEVHTQILQCFGEHFSNIRTGELEPVHQCWVVSSKKIGAEVIKAIMSALIPNRLDRNVRFIDGDALWELIEKFMPVQAVWQKLEEVRKIFDNLDTHYHPQIQLKIDEKFPGASKDKPLLIKPAFSFPDTPEGREAKAAMNNFIATGAPVDIPSPFIKDIVLPEFLEQLSGNIQSFRIEPSPNPKVTLVRIEFKCEDGETFTLEYIQLKIIRAGQEEITLTNDEQGIPVKVALVLYLSDQTVRNVGMEIGVQYSSANVHQLLTLHKLQSCLSKPFLAQVVDIDTGITICDVKQNVGVVDPPYSDLMEVLEDLAAIQVKLKKPIVIPERDFTDEERQTIAQLRTIVQKGKIEGTWNTASFSLLPEDARRTLNTFEGGKTSNLIFQREEIAELFSVQLPLGTVTTIIEQAKLINETEVRNQLANELNDESTIQLMFVAGENNKQYSEYPDWIHYRIQ